MPITAVQSFLVHAGRGSRGSPNIKGTNVPLSGGMFDLLGGIYDSSETECDIDIQFRPSPSGAQQNDCRDLVLAFVSKQTMVEGLALAERLERFTDRRSGLGLLFLIGGKEGRDYKVVLSRFPTDSAILADELQDTLSVRFLERVFMKSKTSYKAVLYRGSSLKADFWQGRAVDRQINAQAGETSNYWIVDFLASNFRLTSAFGTRRLGNAVREAAKKATLDVRSELVSASTLAGNLGGQRTSIADFGSRFSLSTAAREAVEQELPSAATVNEQFVFDASEFNSIVRYRSVELNNGGIMTAPSTDFDQVFPRRDFGKDGDVEFRTRGRVVDERLKKVP